MYRLQLEEQVSKLCISQLFWDNLIPRHKLQGVFTEVYEYMHIVLYITHRSAFFVPACVFLVRVGDKYVNHRSRGSYWVRLCPRFWVPVLKTKCKIFLLRTDRGLQMNLFFFFFNKTWQNVYKLIMARSSLSWTILERLNGTRLMQIKERFHRNIFVCDWKRSKVLNKLWNIFLTTICHNLTPVN